MAKTFEEWQATRQQVGKLPEEYAGAEAGQPGWIYESGFIVRTVDGFSVTSQGQHNEYLEIEGAERFLWDELQRNN